jgi:hypothetical protein
VSWKAAPLQKAYSQDGSSYSFEGELLAIQELIVRRWILLCFMRRNLANTTSIPGQIAWMRLMF